MEPLIYKPHRNYAIILPDILKEPELRRLSKKFRIKKRKSAKNEKNERKLKITKC